MHGMRGGGGGGDPHWANSNLGGMNPGGQNILGGAIETPLNSRALKKRAPKSGAHNGVRFSETTYKYTCTKTDFANHRAIFYS